MAYPFTYPSYQNQNQNYGNFNQQMTPINQPINQGISQPQNNGIIYVQGEAGARAYLVAPNSTVTLWDSEANVIYIKSADASGMPTIKVLDYTVRGGEKEETKTEFATKSDIRNLEKEIKEIKNKIRPQKKTIKKGEEDE